MRRAGRRAAAASLLCLPLLGPSPAPLAAQACTGSPLPAGAWAAGAGVGVSSDAVADGTGGLELGAGAAGRPLDRIGGRATLGRRLLDGTGADAWTARLEVAASLADVPFVSRIPAAPCVVAGLGLAHVSQGSSGSDVANLGVPFGLSFGRALGAGEELVVAPFVTPLLLWSRVDGRVLRVPVGATQLTPAVQVGVGGRHGRLLGALRLFLSGIDGELGPAPWPERLVSLRVGLIL